MGFLASVAREEKVIEVPIQTIYLKDNASTHYRIFRDSMRIAYFPIAYLFAGILLGVLDVVFFRYLYMEPLSTLALGPLMSGFCASFLIFFVYELLMHCAVFFIKPRFKKMVVDFFAFAFLSLACFGISYGLVCAGLPWWGARALSDTMLFLLLLVGKMFLPSGVVPCYVLS